MARYQIVKETSFTALTNSLSDLNSVTKFLTSKSTSFFIIWNYEDRKFDCKTTDIKFQIKSY